MANIKNIKVGNTSYDIEALQFIGGDNLKTPAQWKAYIDQIGELGFDIVVLDTLPTADATNYNTYHNKIVLVTGDAASGSSVEYVIIRSGSSGSYTYSWEQIGTTATKLAEYAKKNVATSTPNTENTGSKDLGTKNTSDSKAVSADAEVSLKYNMPNADTGSTGSTDTANTGNGGSHTVNGSNFTFTGTDQSISVTVTRTTNAGVGNHSYTPAGTVTVNHDAIKDVTLSATTTSGDGLAYVQSVTHTAATLGGTTTFNTDAIKSASLTGTTKFVTSAIKSASLTGTTTFNTDAYKASIDGTTLVLTSAATGVVGISTEAASTSSVGISTTAASKATVTITGGSITPVVRYLKKTTTAATLTPSFTGTAATITHTVTQPAFSGSFNNKNIAGTIGGSQSVGAHSHTYVELPAHTHSISTTATDVSGTVSVPIPSHKHTVTLGSHTHSLNSHTHTQQ